MSDPSEPTSDRLGLSTRGPAAEARAAGEDYGIELKRNPYTPLTDEKGVPQSRIVPYQPVLDACALCPGRCCRLLVKVSIPDAIIFCRTLMIPIFAGLTMVRSDHAAHSFRIDRDSRLVPDDEGWPGKVELQLRRKSDGTCHALVNLGGYDRCGAYSARPSFCRTYPVAWTSKVAEGGPPMVMCPVGYAVPPAAAQQFLADIEDSIDRWALHDELVEDWNALDLGEGGYTIERFLEFALPRAGERMGVPVDGLLASGFPEQRLYDAMLATGVVKAANRLPIVEPARPYAGLVPPKKNED